MDMTTTMLVPILPTELWEMIMYELAHSQLACHPQANREPLNMNTCGCENCMAVHVFAEDYFWVLFVEPMVRHQRLAYDPYELHTVE